MKKIHKFTTLSPDHICIGEGCRKHIKQRLIDIKKFAPKRCYRCYIAMKQANNVK